MQIRAAALTNRLAMQSQPRTATTATDREPCAENWTLALYAGAFSDTPMMSGA